MLSFKAPLPPALNIVNLKKYCIAKQNLNEVWVSDLRLTCKIGLMFLKKVAGSISKIHLISIGKRLL